MNMINNQWFVGVVLLIVGFILGQLFPTRALYSATQNIRLWPPSLGGNDILKLDNLVTLKTGVLYDERSITMLLAVVPIEEESIENQSFRAEGIQKIYHKFNQKYIFDIFDQKTHRISYGGRDFLVTLNKIRKIPIKGVSLALEYEFGISELSIFEKIKNYFKK